MDYKSIAKEIIELKNADLTLRDRLVRSGQLGEGYNEEMEELHNKNAKVLNDIIDTIGYPTIDKVGKEANEATWLVIQHSIGQPEFMKKCVKLLEISVSKNNSDSKNLAYLTDRIAVLEGKPQLYGTQFDWDKFGSFSPNPFDDLNKVNERRKSIGLNTIEEQTEIIRARVKIENQLPPKDFEKIKQEIEQWKKNVGWTK
jgi:archaellum component FlaC